MFWILYFFLIYYIWGDLLYIKNVFKYLNVIFRMNVILILKINIIMYIL